MSEPVRAISNGATETAPAVSGELLAELREYCVRLARHFGAMQAAEDVAQDAMMTFLVADEVEAPYAWLRTVVRRLVSLRHRDLHAHESVDGIPRAESPRSAATTDQLVLFRQVLSRLPARDRRILMFKLRGYSYGEMARRLGCRPSAVGTTVNRTFGRVRRLVEHGVE
ncbi:MAG: RNA polymerase sigma factor [Thermoanaerobaculia bacterium]